MPLKSSRRLGLLLKAINDVVRAYHQAGKKFKVVPGGEAGETNVDAEFRLCLSLTFNFILEKFLVNVTVSICQAMGDSRTV